MHVRVCPVLSLETGSERHVQNIVVVQSKAAFSLLVFVFESIRQPLQKTANSDKTVQLEELRRAAKLS